MKCCNQVQCFQFTITWTLNAPLQWSCLDMWCSYVSALTVQKMSSVSFVFLFIPTPQECIQHILCAQVLCNVWNERLQSWTRKHLLVPTHGKHKGEREPPHDYPWQVCCTSKEYIYLGTLYSQRSQSLSFPLFSVLLWSTWIGCSNRKECIKPSSVPECSNSREHCTPQPKKSAVSSYAGLLCHVLPCDF